MQFTLNGQNRDYRGDPNRSLLNYLRNEEGIISPKDGCSGQGACGCCSVLLTDQKGTRSVLSCTTQMKRVEGLLVTTAEGMEKKIQEAFSRAFVKKGGIQCGFCTPGIVMQAASLLRKNLEPTREEVIKAINVNLCRCTGYVKIVDSILLAAESIRENKVIEIEKEKTSVGDAHPKYETLNAVLGQRPFVCDLKAPGMKFGALKFSDYPRAKVLEIDFKAAEKLAGVIRVFTAQDIPGERIIGLITEDWPVMVKIGEETRYIGDVLAGVVADSEETARRAVALIKVNYEILEPVTDPNEALKSSAPKIHPANAHGNILGESEVKRGDLDKAIKESAYVVKGFYKSQRIEHAFMEPECCFVKSWIKDGKKGIEVFSQGQGVYEDRKQIAKILGLPQEQVKVVQVQNGGGFGGKEDMTVQGHAALFAYKLGVPVRVALTRDESINMHPKRHPMEMDYTLGCDKNGKFTFLKANIVGDTGAYASVGAKVLERAAGHCASAYVVPNLDVKAVAVYTNNIPNGAMRGFGVNQAAFAMESCIEELCKKGGFDPWKCRHDNAVRDGQMISTGQIVQGAGVVAALEALEPEYQKAKNAGKSIGLAVGIKNTGIGNGMADIGRAKIVIKSEHEIEVQHGWTEMGQGVHTMAVQSFCEETGIDPRMVKVKVETPDEVVTGMTTSSRGTSLVGHAIIRACKELKEDLKKRKLAELIGKSYFGEWICDWTTKPGYEKEGEKVVTHYSYGYAAQMVVLDEKGKIEKIVAAHDAGKIMNKTLFEGQIEGAIHMGLGYGITEELVLEKGRPVTTKLGKLGILRAKEMPHVEVKGVEVNDPHGPFGAKGVGEIGLVPTAAAVACALYRYDGIKRYELPLKEKRLLKVE